jgi:hypothetical protein
MISKLCTFVLTPGGEDEGIIMKEKAKGNWLDKIYINAVLGSKYTTLDSYNRS